jgi:periplasmic protein TonB
VRNAVIGSAVVHIGVIAALFAVRTGTPIVIPGPDVIQVALVEPTDQPITPPVVAPPPETRREVPDLAPEEPDGGKAVKPKPAPKPREKKPAEPRPAETAAPAPALPYAAVGGAGLRGQVALDQGDFEFSYYLLLVRNRIAQSWSPPAGLATGGQPVHAVVYFRIARDGSLSEIRLETASRVEFFDRSATRAVMISDPLPPLPLGYAGGTLGVHFGFEYATP